MAGTMRMTLGMRTLFSAVLDEGLRLEYAGGARRSRRKRKYRARANGSGRVSDLIDEMTVRAAVRRGYLDEQTLEVTPAGQRAWKTQG